MRNILFNKIPETLLILLIVFTPVAFGSVHVWAYTVMEMTVLLIISLALFKIVWGYEDIQWVKHPINVFMALFVFYISLQMVQLSEETLQTISPGAYQIHQKYLEWFAVIPDQSQFSVSLNAHKTRVELFKLLAYFGAFFYVINNIHRRDQINRVIAAVLIVGCMESLYAIYQRLSGVEKILWVDSSLQSSGTFINKNNFAGYLELIIILLCGQTVYFFAKNKLVGRNGQNLGLRSILGALWKHEAKFNKQILIIYAIALIGIAVIFSQSRGGVLAAIAGISTVFIFSHTRGKLKKLFFFAR